MQLTSGTFVMSSSFVSESGVICVLAGGDTSGDPTIGVETPVSTACDGDGTDVGDLTTATPGVTDSVSIVVAGTTDVGLVPASIFAEEESKFNLGLGVYCCTNGDMIPNSQEVTWWKEDTDSTMDSVT